MRMQAYFAPTYRKLIIEAKLLQGSRFGDLQKMIAKMKHFWQQTLKVLFCCKRKNGYKERT